MSSIRTALATLFHVVQTTVTQIVQNQITVHPQVDTTPATGVTYETVQEVHPNATYTVANTRVPASGVNPTIRVGMKVPVARVQGVPKFIIAHSARRAQFGGEVPIEGQVVEELYVAPPAEGGFGWGDVYYRNSDQVTLLKTPVSEGGQTIREKIGNTDTSTQIWVRWAEGGNLLLVRDGDDFSLPEERKYYVFRLNRGKEDPLGSKTATVSTVARYQLAADLRIVEINWTVNLSGVTVLPVIRQTGYSFLSTLHPLAFAVADPIELPWSVVYSASSTYSLTDCFISDEYLDVAGNLYIAVTVDVSTVQIADKNNGGLSGEGMNWVQLDLLSPTWPPSQIARTNDDIFVPGWYTSSWTYAALIKVDPSNSGGIVWSTSGDVLNMSLESSNVRIPYAYPKSGMFRGGDPHYPNWTFLEYNLYQGPDNGSVPGADIIDLWHLLMPTLIHYDDYNLDETSTPVEKWTFLLRAPGRGFTMPTYDSLFNHDLGELGVRTITATGQRALASFLNQEIVNNNNTSTKALSRGEAVRWPFTNFVDNTFTLLHSPSGLSGDVQNSDGMFDCFSTGGGTYQVVRSLSGTLYFVDFRALSVRAKIIKIGTSPSEARLFVSVLSDDKAGAFIIDGAGNVIQTLQSLIVVPADPGSITCSLQDASLRHVLWQLSISDGGLTESQQLIDIKTGVRTNSAVLPDGAKLIQPDFVYASREADRKFLKAWEFSSGQPIPVITAATVKTDQEMNAVAKLKNLPTPDPYSDAAAQEVANGFVQSVWRVVNNSDILDYIHRYKKSP